MKKMTLAEGVKEVLLTEFFLAEEQAEQLIKRYSAVILEHLDPENIAESIYIRANEAGFFNEEDNAT